MTTVETATAPAPPPAAPAPSAARTGRVIGGSMLAAVGAVLALGGGTVLAFAGTDNTFDTGRHDVSTPTTALVSDVADIDGADAVGDVLGNPRVKVSAQASGSGAPVFVGVARAADVDRYLAGAGIDTVDDFDTYPFRLETERRAGTARPRPPATQSFWVARSSGRTASLDWKVTDGRYRVVVMNADGSRRVSTDSSFGVTIPHISTIALITLLVGLGTIGGGVALLVARTRRDA